MKKVLVTGGTGMTGRFLVEELVRRGVEVRVSVRDSDIGPRDGVEYVEGDMFDAEYCKGIVEGVDYVFHLASIRKNVEYHHEHAEEVIEGNVAMTQNLIDALDPSVPVCFFSSANIPASADIDELASQTEGDGYKIGKARCEKLWNESGHSVLILRPVNIYGPGDYFAVDGNVIPSLIVKAQQSDDQLVVWGSGKQARSYLYVEDIPGAVLKLIDAGAEGVQYLYPSEAVTIASLAEKIRDLVKPELELFFDTSKPEGALKVELPALDSSLEGFEWMELDEGLRRTVEYLGNRT